MPKVAKYVEWNNGGEWSYALVKKDHGGGSLTVLFKVEGEGGWELGSGSEGTSPGCWREPQD